MNDPYLVIDYNYNYAVGDNVDSIDLDYISNYQNNYSDYYKNNYSYYSRYYYEDYCNDYPEDCDPDVMADSGSFSDAEDGSTLAEFLKSDGWSITKVILYSFTIVIIIVSNILLLIVIRKVRYLKTSANRYVVTLAIADVMMGLYTALKIAETLAPSLRRNLYLCLGVQLGWICISTVSQLLVLFLTFDCYFALWHPITYNQVLTAFKANVAIFIAWIYSGAVALIPLVWIKEWNSPPCFIENIVIHKYLVFILLHFCVAFIIATIVFLFVYYEIHTSKVVLKVYKKRKKQRQVYEERRKKDVQNAHCMTITIALYFVFWLPYYIMLSINMYYVRTALSTLLESIAVILVILHSGVNPAIYVCKLHTFQIACYKVLCCFFSRHFPSRPPSDNVQLRSLSFRNHATGSMMSLHTTIGNDGKIVRVPQSLISDYEQQRHLRPHHGSLRPNNYHHPSGRYPPIDENTIDVWFTPDSPDLSGVTGEIYRTRNRPNNIGTTFHINNSRNMITTPPHTVPTAAVRPQHSFNSGHCMRYDSNSFNGRQNRITVPIEHH